MEMKIDSRITKAGIIDIIEEECTGTGDVLGPASSTDNAIARYNGTDGTSIQNSSVTIDDNNVLSLGSQLQNKTQTLTDAANVDWDANNGNYATITFGGDRTMNAVTNQVNGGIYKLIIIAGASNRTITWNSNYLFSGGIDPISFLSGTTSILEFISNGTNMIFTNASYNVA